MELWERGTALDELDELLHSSASGGRIALVAGEAGIGKSSLVTEFARRSRENARVLWGGCDRLVTPRALGPVHDIARATGGELAGQLAAGAKQEDIFAAFLDVLADPPQRLGPVVVVEDAHWADEATLDWLSFLGRRLGRFSTLLVITYRDDEVGAEHPLRRLLAALPASVARRVPVTSLSENCVLEQARRAGRDPETVYRLSGGNPLLVTELLKSDADTVPGAVQDLILDRIAALPEPARDVAQLVAVVPTRAELALTGATETVDQCISAGVLIPAGDAVAYRHELLRGAVENSLSPGRRATLHRRVLGALAADTRSDPGRLVHHARLAGDTDAVLRYGRLAGEGAARQGAHREAAAHYRAAAAEAGRLAEPDRAELLEAYANEAYLTGSHEEAIQAREAALTIREALGQPEQVGENLRWISRLCWWTGRIARARAVAQKAVAVLEAAPTSTQLAMAYSNQAQLELTTHGLEEAVAWAERARVLAERLGDEATAIHATITMGTAWLVAAIERGRTTLEEAHRRADARGLVDHAGRAVGNVALVYADELGEYDEAVPLVDRALAYNEAHDLDGMYNMVLGGRAKLRFERGDWGGALADADATLARSGPRGVNAVLPLVVRGRVQAACGEPAALVTLDEAAREAEGVGDVPMVVPVLDARSEYFLWAGDPARAQAEALRGLALIGGDRGQPFMAGRLAWRLWRAGGGDALPVNAAEPFRMMVRGDWAGAAADWERRGATYLRADALGAGDEAAAAEALRILDRLGATQAAEKLRAELRRRGIRAARGPRRTTVSNSAGLTPRQMDVLALLVDGLSNAEIAARLTLSEKTVDHHVSALLGKLGATNRGQAVATAHRLNLIPQQVGEISRSVP